MRIYHASMFVCICLSHLLFLSADGADAVSLEPNHWALALMSDLDNAKYSFILDPSLLGPNLKIVP